LGTVGRPACGRQAKQSNSRNPPLRFPPKVGVISIAVMLNKHGRVVETERLEFKEWKDRKI